MTVPAHNRVLAMEPLKIGVSARLLYPDPTRSFLPAKSVQYLEQSVANWIMSVPNLAGQRAIVIGIALGVVSLSLRVILGVERSHLGSDKG